MPAREIRPGDIRILNLSCSAHQDTNASDDVGLSRSSCSLNREQVAMRSVIPSLETEERIMPVLILWAVPAVIVIGGATYWLAHLH
jgi:hypothetical protein